jgi:MYXO-CTERM domain-containing protein
MNVRGLFASMVAVTAGCTGAGGDADEAGAFRVDRIEAAVDGTPYFVSGELGRIAAGGAARIDSAEGAAEAVAGALPAIASTLHVPAADLVARRVDQDRIGMTHVRMEQRKNGLRVVGGDVVLHMASDGAIQAVTSTARDREVDATPAIAADAAAGLAVQATGGDVQAKGSELLYVVSTGDGELYLAWEVEVVGQGGLLLDDRVYVDAHGGKIVDRRPLVFTARNRTIYDGKGGTYPVFFAAQVGAEASPPSSDQIALAAFTNTGLTYDCYQALYQRDSYDNGGAGLDSMVHVVFQIDQQGHTTANNAAWVQPLGQMAYGDGDGSFMGPTPLGFDVTAHELTHAVTAATADLAYQNEPGALNEGMSDIMGAVCEAWRDKAVSAKTWLVGEDIFTPSIAGDALRYMANPTADKALYPPALGGSRDFYAERYTGGEDSGGVHLNSGIANLAFYLLASGGTHPRSKTTVAVPGLGIEKAGAIFQRALTKGYFTANTNFAQARTATEQVAQELYPGCAKVAVSAAWAAVGVGAAPAPDAVAPTTEITAPADGATVMPGFQVQVNASDDQCVLKVELAIDGKLVATAAAPPFTFPTDVGLAPGTHTIQVTTYDAVNKSTDTATVTIPTTPAGCASDSQCGDGERCEAGTCQPDTGAAPGGCGCSTDGRRGAAGALALAIAMAFALRRRRAR